MYHGGQSFWTQGTKVPFHHMTSLSHWGLLGFGALLSSSSPMEPSPVFPVPFSYYSRIYPLILFSHIISEKLHMKYVSGFSEGVVWPEVADGPGQRSWLIVGVQNVTAGFYKELGSCCVYLCSDAEACVWEEDLIILLICWGWPMTSGMSEGEDLAECEP